MYIAFINLKKAYDTENRVKLNKVFRQAQVGKGLMRAHYSSCMNGVR